MCFLELVLEFSLLVLILGIIILVILFLYRCRKPSTIIGPLFADVVSEEVILVVLPGRGLIWIVPLVSIALRHTLVSRKVLLLLLLLLLVLLLLLLRVVRMVVGQLLGAVGVCEFSVIILKDWVKRTDLFVLRIDKIKDIVK